MKTQLTSYENRLEKFQQRLEELAIEKELLLSRLFATKEKLEKIKGKIELNRARSEERLISSLDAIEKSNAL